MSRRTKLRESTQQYRRINGIQTFLPFFVHLYVDFYDTTDCKVPDTGKSFCSNNSNSNSEGQCLWCSRRGSATAIVSPVLW